MSAWDIRNGRVDQQLVTLRHLVLFFEGGRAEGLFVLVNGKGSIWKKMKRRERVFLWCVNRHLRLVPITTASRNYPPGAAPPRREKEDEE